MSAPVSMPKRCGHCYRCTGKYIRSHKQPTFFRTSSLAIKNFNHFSLRHPPLRLCHSLLVGFYTLWDLRWMGWFLIYSRIWLFPSPKYNSVSESREGIGMTRATDRINGRRKDLVNFVFVCLLWCQILISDPLSGILGHSSTVGIPTEVSVMYVSIRLAAFPSSGTTITHGSAIKVYRSHNIDSNFILETVQMPSSKTNFAALGFSC